VPLLLFVLFISVVAELSDRAGVFSVLAERMAVLARGSVVALWLLMVLLATAATVVLSLDSGAAPAPEKPGARHWIRRQQLQLAPRPGPGSWKRSRG